MDMIAETFARYRYKHARGLGQVRAEATLAFESQIPRSRT